MEITKIRVDNAGKQQYFLPFIDSLKFVDFDEKIEIALTDVMRKVKAFQKDEVKRDNISSQVKIMDIL